MTIEKLIQFLINQGITVDYCLADNSHQFTFLGDLFAHKCGYMQTYCTISTEDEDAAIRLMEIPTRISLIQDISLYQTEFNIIYDVIERHFMKIPEVKITSGTQFLK